MERIYETQGTLFVVPTMTAQRGIVAFDFKDYEGMVAAGLMNEEVDAVIKKADYGEEYQKAPELKIRGGLYRIEMDAARPKPQIDFSEETLDQLRERGFRDSEKVNVRIEGLPYKSYREANYDDVKWGID